MNVTPSTPSLCIIEKKSRLTHKTKYINENTSMLVNLVNIKRVITNS